MLTQEEELKAMDLYRNTELSLREIAKEFNVSRSTIGKIMRKNNVKKDRIAIISEEFKKEGYILLSKEYKNSLSKLEYICPQHGKKTITWQRFKNEGQRCKECSYDKQKNDFDKIKEAFQDKGYDLLSEEYINSKSPLKYLCPKHGVKSMAWNDFSSGKQCPECSIENKMKDYENIKAAFKRKGYDLISDKYLGSKEPLLYLCPKHGKQETTWNRFQQGDTCSECLKEERNIKMLEVIRVAFYEKGYTLLSREYINNREKLYYLCPKHGKQSISWMGFQQGQQCKLCSYENQPGIYNVALAERNKEAYKKEKATLYFVSFNNKVNEESFLKIGITINSINERFHALKGKYNIEKIKTFELNLYDAIHLEDSILSEFSEYKYVPQNKFDGYTECLKTNYKKILSYMNKAIGENKVSA